MKVFDSSALIALAAVLVSGTAQAQGQCAIDDSKPKQVKEAKDLITKAELFGKPEDKAKNIAAAVKVLTTEPEKINNPVGRSYYLGKAYVLLAAQPNAPTVVNRGSIGFTASPEATIDLVAAADSAFDAVEAASPDCKAETEQERRKIYGPLVNEAVNLYNARQVDSAVVLARRGLSIYPSERLSYIAYNVLGNALQSKDDMPGAIDAFTKMAEVMAGDTATADERKNVMLNVAALKTSEAEKLEGAAKVDAMKGVVAYLEGYLKEFPDDVKAKSAVARAQLMAGDSTAANRLFSEMLKEPDKYTDMQLFEAGVGAARSERGAEAAALFEAGLKKNPHYRDGLFNLAATYNAIDSLDKMPAILTRLQVVDPNNPENYRLWAIYYQSKAAKLKPLAAKKPASDPASKAVAANNDSLLKYFKQFQEAPVKVTFNLFSREEGKASVGGAIENLTDAEKSYTLKMHFLDASGAVLDSKEVKVDAVAGKASKPFRIESDKPGVVAFKYDPLAS